MLSDSLCIVCKGCGHCDISAERLAELLWLLPAVAQHPDALGYFDNLTSCH